MSDYIANLLQREIGAGAKSLRPMTPPAYLPIPQNEVMASEDERFEIQREMTLDQSPPARFRARMISPNLPEADDELQPQAKPHLSPSETGQQAPRVEITELISSRDTGVEQMESIAMAPTTQLAPSPILPEIRKAKTAEKGTIKPRPEPLSLRFGGEQNMPPVERTNASKSETTIRVAIGRIEVRAIMPQQASHKAPAPTQPKMSLEDYLRQRNGERRS